ncbi:PadR family transcriptional regulator [Nocardioides sp. Soil797]|nr:PadR family transcriptional regulator [Nocardioides sp. Soil797]
MKTTDATTSNLGHAILGLLARTPLTGYDLAQRMRRPIGYFWSARHSQIYPELARLEAAGLIRHEVIDGAGPRPTKRYSLAPAGLAALRDWVVAEPSPQPVRDLEVLRLWSMWTVAPESAIELVESCRRDHRTRLAEYETELAEFAQLPEARDPGAPLFASRVTLEYGIRTQRAAVDWCEWMLGELVDASPPDPSTPHHGRA